MLEIQENREGSKTLVAFDHVLATDMMADVVPSRSRIRAMALIRASCETHEHMLVNRRSCLRLVAVWKGWWCLWSGLGLGFG